VGRKRAGSEKERPYTELGDYLAQLRRSIGLSQHELAEKSLLTKHPFDRTCVARIENGETADTAAKFLTYISLLQAHPETVVEIIETSNRYVEVAEDLPLPECYARVREAEAHGAYGLAIGYALSGLARAREEKDEEWHGRLSIAAAIVFRNQNALSIAQRFATNVLNGEGVSHELRATASLLIAGICVENEQPHSGRGALRSIDRSLLESHPDLLANYLGASASIAAALGESEVAEGEFAEAAELFEAQGNRKELARARYWQSRLALAAGDAGRARRFAESAVDLSRSGPFELLLGYCLLALGQAQAAAGELADARRHLIDSEARASRCDDTLLLLETRAQLMEVARRQPDAALYRFLRRRVEQGLRIQRVSKVLRKQIETLLATANEGAQ
jgi:transcriptional regulator with XRE-family HTH domain